MKKPVRRSQMISPWGIGSICNFPGDESLMVCGLDAWEQVYKSAYNGYDEFILREERLENRLRVASFRFPPDFRKPGKGVHNPSLKIPFVRFPQWHYCPKCGSMEKLAIYGDKQPCKGYDYADGMSCYSKSPKKRPYLIPSRFICVCGYGHIEDFPFMEWVHGERACNDDCRLRLRAGRSGSSLSGIFIECVTCDLRKSMGGAFNEGSLNKIKSCNGFRPWLGEIDERADACGNELRVVQRGATNVYFPQIRSSIYLPKWGSSTKRRIVEVLDRDWENLTRSRVNGELNRAVFEFIANKYNIDVEELLNAAYERLYIENQRNDDRETDDSEESYRRTEYEAILTETGGDNQDFFVTNLDASEYSEPVSRYFKSISLVRKLRETRALAGFSRLLPEDRKTLREMKDELSLSRRINWLPAIIVRGEGIFFEFNQEEIDKWLKKNTVFQRFDQLSGNYNRARLNRSQEERRLNSRFVLIHIFAHIIINQFSYVCGYGSSALRERIYCDCDPETPDAPMNGVLIYTASGDSEGSLGGLVRQGKPGYLEDIVESALQSAKWCSADPICIESSGQGPDSCNLAACHNCALLPETCCEEGNRLLDRALLSGTLEKPEIGYFCGFDEFDE